MVNSPDNVNLLILQEREYSGLALFVIKWILREELCKEFQVAYSIYMMLWSILLNVYCHMCL